MPIYEYSNGGDDYFGAMTPEELRWSRSGAQAAGLDLGSIPMSDDPLDPDAPVASMLWLPPHTTLDRHGHHCHRVEVVVRGSISVGDRVLHPGDVWTAGPGEMYGPHTAGPEGCLSVEIFSSNSKRYPTIHDDDQSPEAAARQQLVAEAIQAARAAQ